MPDSNWLEATDPTSDVDLRVGFPSVTDNPSGTQAFRAWLRKTTGTSNPTVDIYLYEDGSSVRKIIDALPITSLTGEIVTAEWDASELSDASGVDVECRIYGHASAPTISFIAKGTAAATTDTSMSVGYPAGIQEGDLLILQIGTTDTSNNNVTANLPTDWLFKHGSLVSGSTYLGEGSAVDGKQIIFYRFVPSGGLSGSLAITVATPQTNEATYGQMYAFRGVNPSTPFEGGELQSGSGTTVSMPSVTTTGINRLVVAFYMIGSSTSVANSTGESGGDWTEVAAEDANTTGNDGTIGCQSALLASAGTISGGSFSVTSGGWACRGFALIPLDGNTVEIGALKWMSDVEEVGLTPVTATIGSFIEALRNTEIDQASYHSAMAYKSIDRGSFVESLQNKELTRIGFHESMTTKGLTKSGFIEVSKLNKLTLASYQENIKNMEISSTSFIEYLKLLDITYEDFLESKKTSEISFSSFLESKKTFKLTRTGFIENTGLVLSPVSATLISYLEYLFNKESDLTGYLENSQNKEITRTSYYTSRLTKNLYSNSYIEYLADKSLSYSSFIEFIQDLVVDNINYIEYTKGHSTDSVNYLENINTRKITNTSYLERLKYTKHNLSSYISSLQAIKANYPVFIESLRTFYINQISFYDNLGLILTEITPVLSGFLEYTSQLVNSYPGYMTFVKSLKSTSTGYMISNTGHVMSINSYIELLQSHTPVNTGFIENLNTRLMPNESFFSCEGVVLKVVGSFIENLRLTSTGRTTAYDVLQLISNDFDSYYSFVDRLRIQESGYLSNTQVLIITPDSYLESISSVITELSSDYRTLERLLPVLISYGEALRTIGISEQAYLDYTGYVARFAEFVRIISIALKASKLEDISISKSGLKDIKLQQSKLDDIKVIK